MRRLIVLSALMLAGCAPAIDRVTATDFVPTGNGGFRFKTMIAVQYPDNPSGEAMRMEMLQGWLSQNSMCGAGYTITSRQPVQRTAFVSDVYYEGKCK